MQSLHQRVSSFLYEIMFTDGLPRSIREEAYRFHIELETGQTPKVEFTVPSSGVHFYLTRPEYNLVTEHFKACHKIDGIKLIRTCAHDQHVELGLKDAKDIIDNWNLAL